MHPTPLTLQQKVIIGGCGPRLANRLTEGNGGGVVYLHRHPIRYIDPPRVYRGTSPIINTPLLGPYSSIPRVICWS